MEETQFYIKIKQYLINKYTNEYIEEFNDIEEYEQNVIENIFSEIDESDENAQKLLNEININFIDYYKMIEYLTSECDEYSYEYCCTEFNGVVFNTLVHIFKNDIISSVKLNY